VADLLASFATSFTSRKAQALSVAQRTVMDLTGDGSLSALATEWGQKAEKAHCLIFNASFFTKQDDRDKHSSLVSTALSVDERTKQVLAWLPALNDCGLTWLSPKDARLHLYFKDHASLAKALKAVPALVRCGTLGWMGASAECVSCSGKEGKYLVPEALRFSVIAKQALPNTQARLVAAQAFLKELQIDVQCVWQSQPRQPNTPNDMQVSFWALPREADINALVSLLNRVNGKHTLFGGHVYVHGPNSPQLQRCRDCQALGHAQKDCPLFGGVAVRLVFKNPLSPAAFASLQQHVKGVQSAMLGNAMSRDHWCAAHKATLFFHCSDAELKESLIVLWELCSSLLHEPMSTVSMTESARRQECARCGSRSKEHVCPFFDKSHGPMFQQQQHKQPTAPKASSAAAAAPTPAAAAAKATSVVAKPRFAGMCGFWRMTGACSRAGCKQLHMEGWIPPPDGCCRDFYFGACKRPEGTCSFTHLTLEDAQTKQGAAAPPAGARPPPVVTARGAKKPAAAAGQGKQPQGQGNNRFAPLSSAAASASAAAAPATPRKPSSLDSLTSPQRSVSLPFDSAAAASSRPTSRRGSVTVARSLASDLGASAAGSSAAAAEGGDDGPYQLQQRKGRKRKETSLQEAQERKAAPQPRTQAQQQQAQQQQTQRAQQHPQQQEDLEDGELRADDAEHMQED